MELNGFLEFSIWNNQTQNWDGFGSAPADNCDIYGNSSREKLKILRISLPLAALSLLSALCLILYIRRKKKKEEEEEEDRNQQRFSEVLKLTGRGNRSSEMFRINESKDDDLDLPLFDFATILEATSNFSLNNKLGEGGFGPVYKDISEAKYGEFARDDA
ncbi:G-type lectin S-receptor-like serine/threonine-protein kinase At1g11330 isoform X2 [Nicotiana tabacum]|uniref:G-type lectin S-receptor-like serine/threonine-protein kinase At1g11330 isoform X2 n=1 Tax=Nicotiana tabacum TaxID=4097 RepID=A0A1S4B9H8_TOBAC|nr:PREDICTED: G-type lectin S-receptor-like serine/threonine-protein kinase At1g11330 isoform X2 [Nicotiana tabacum]XP_016485529.1 PREDICTED: G-type lectin S-receptor-like serine/threonine-protein kinase At1g11330 isoform X2 [Nicotiana tabacum]